MFKRPDGRKYDELRSVKITRNFITYAEGSVLFEAGNTRVICTASMENKVPPFIKEQGHGGWITAEYSLIPRATQTRIIRDSVKGQINGRSQEIQRLVGRSLRAVVDLEALDGFTIWIDCDVIQADGGTRTASITGAFIALHDCLSKLLTGRKIAAFPINDYVAAVSVGKVDDELLLDLCFEEDKIAQVDMNIVMTGSSKLIEIQGTGEAGLFSKEEMDAMVSLGQSGIKKLIELQMKTIGEDLVKK
ncbi:MAG: ribonuclease PH [Actinobacteria bacterium]|nr:ribonuclease PH [Actinomycetota bacterium]